MQEDFTFYLLAFFIAFSVSLLLTPYTKTLSKKLNVLATPNERSMHKEPKGLLGGVAIFAGFYAGVLLLFFYTPDLQGMPREIFYKEFTGFLIGGVLIFIVGLLDDKYTMPAKVKLFCQIVVAVVVISFGITVDFIDYPLTVPIEAQWLNKGITLIWIVGIINAMNIIDGIDGLAAGVSAISSLFLTVLCFLSGSPISVILSASLAGSCLGFLPRNFYPSEIFMGDTGAMFLGYVLSVASILGLFKSYALLSIVISVLVLAFPIFDVGFAMIRRLLSGKPIMTADRGHLHHRIYDAGFNEKQTVAILYCVSFVCAMLALVIAVRDYRAVLLLILCVFVLFAISISYKVKNAKLRASMKDTEKKLNKEQKEKDSNDIDENRHNV
ncbi:MAG: MraY family glycosyltransferase [Lachnospirales bacterium]